MTGACQRSVFYAPSQFWAGNTNMTIGSFQRSNAGMDLTDVRFMGYGSCRMEGDGVLYGATNRTRKDLRSGPHL